MSWGCVTTATDGRAAPARGPYGERSRLGLHPDFCNVTLRPWWLNRSTVGTGVVTAERERSHFGVGNEDEVRLAVPAKPEFLGLARVTATGLASRLGFTFDQVEDLRLAIDEVCFGMTGTKGRDGVIEVRFVLGDDALAIRGQGHFATPGPVHLSEISEVILDALVDEHSLSDGAGGPRFKLVKKRSTKGVNAGHGTKEPKEPKEPNEIAVTESGGPGPGLPGPADQGTPGEGQ